MNTSTHQDSTNTFKAGPLKVCLVLGFLIVGLALAPGYLLLCGSGSGVRVSTHNITCQSLDPNSAENIQTTSLELSPSMNPLGINLVMTTPFRDYSAAEAGQFHARLSKDGITLWDSLFYLANAQKKEAISGTSFLFRAKTFSVSDSGVYEFSLHRRQAMDGINSVQLEVRKNVAMPNRYIVGLGILILAGVIIWAILPSKHHDPNAERTGTQWWQD